MFIKNGDNLPITAIIKSKKDIEEAKKSLKKVISQIENKQVLKNTKVEESK